MVEAGGRILAVGPEGTQVTVPSHAHMVVRGSVAVPPPVPRLLAPWAEAGGCRQVFLDTDRLRKGGPGQAPGPEGQNIVEKMVYSDQFEERTKT